MKTFDETTYNPTAEKLVEILCHKTRMNPLFMRVLVGYYFALAAAQMRATIATHDRGDIPVSLYALNLSPSGTGKGVSTGFMENQVMHLFRERFLNETFPTLAEQNLPKLAHKRAVRKGVDPDDELIKVTKEFDSLGNLAFNFDSGTPAAVKQMRHKLLMADAGSVNLQIDEIGANLVGNLEVLNTFLELYDGRGQAKADQEHSRQYSFRGNHRTHSHQHAALWCSIKAAQWWQDRGRAVRHA